MSSATALSTPSPAGCTALPTNNTRPSGGICRSTKRLEFPSMQTSSEITLRRLFGSHSFSDSISVLSAVEVYTTMRYINHIYLLTYVLTSREYGSTSCTKFGGSMAKFWERKKSKIIRNVQLRSAITAFLTFYNTEP